LSFATFSPIHLKSPLLNSISHFPPQSIILWKIWLGKNAKYALSTVPAEGSSGSKFFIKILIPPSHFPMNVHKISFQIRDIGTAITFEIGPANLAIAFLQKFPCGAF
jgi:hypothetical protein